MRARIAYQAMLFFNSTLLYSFAVRSTGSRDLLFFSAFIAALSLVANLAVQLSDSQFRSGIWGLKIASVALLTWVCLRTGIAPPTMALVLGVAVILLTHRNALAGAPNRLSLALAGVPILATTVWTLLAWTGLLAVNGNALLLLLILPYLLTALANRRCKMGDRTLRAEGEHMHAWTLIVSQLLPTVSFLVMLTLVSYEKDATAVANFVMMERAVAIGGSLVYFYARVKGAVPPFPIFAGVAFLVTTATVSLAAVLDSAGPMIAVAYLASGCLLSYGTISLGFRYSRGILAINGVALIAVAFASSRFLTLHPVEVLALYICLQLLLMSGLVVFASRNHA